MKTKFYLIVNLFSLLLTSGNIIAQDTVQIGNQVWMAKNLNIDKFRNGELILEAKTTNEWLEAAKNKMPAWCYYNNDTINGIKYGRLYNWYAVSDPRGLVPTGWHIPKNTEWKQLANYLGGDGFSGMKMKSASGWSDAKGKSGNGTNESGFLALPGGFRNYDGTFGGISEDGHWWCTDEYSPYLALFLFLNNGYGTAGMNIYFKEGGFSVRCLRD